MSSKGASQDDFDKEAKDAVVELRETFESGRMSSLKSRMEVLLQFKEMLNAGREKMQEALWKDLHKNKTEGYICEINQVEHEVQHMIDHLEEYAAPENVSTNLLNLPGSSAIRCDPLGVCLVIGAWNYPVYLSLIPLVGCLAAGNTAILKMPSDKYTKHVSSAVASLIRKYFDPDVLRCIEGDRRATQAVLKQRYDLIFFTGGSYVGKMVAQSAAKHLTPTVLELGGKSPTIVTGKANVYVAARRTAWGAFTNAGQTCVRPDHVFVHESVSDEFLRVLKEAVLEFYSSKPHETKYFGRLVNARARARVAKIVENDRRYVFHGGDTTSFEDDNDYYVSPTILDFGSDFDAFYGSASMQDEIFGPILPVVRYQNLNRVMKEIRSREKPLALYCYTECSKERERVLMGTTSGGAVVNDCMVHLSNPSLPFGGVGMSGMGSYHGRQSFHTFSHRKSVLCRSTFGDVSARYPPYVPWKVKLLDFVQAARSASSTRKLRFVLYLILLYMFSKFTRLRSFLREFLVKLVRALL